MIISIIFILLLAIGFGLPLTLLIASKHHPISRLGLSYLLGLGIFTLLMTITNFAGLKFTFPNMTVLLGVVSLPFIFFARKRLVGFCKELGVSFKNPRFDFIEKAMLVTLIFIVISSFIATLYWPVYVWDALTLYDFRGRLFAETGFIVSAIGLAGGGYYLGYPFFTSLTHTIVYLSGGTNPQFVYSLIYLSFGIVFYGLLREFVSRKLGLLFTVILLTFGQVFNNSMVAYTNLPFMTFFGLGAIYYCLWDKKYTSGYLVLSAILMGLSTWTRSSEPMWLGVLVAVILVSILKRKYLDIIVFSVLFFPVKEFWIRILNNFTSSQTSTISGITVYLPVLSNVLDFQRWGNIISFLYESVISVWGIIPVIFVLSFVYAIFTKKIKQIYVIYLLTIVTLGLLLIGTFIFSYTFPLWSDIPDSASRMAMIYYPLFVYSIALVFANKNEK